MSLVNPLLSLLLAVNEPAAAKLPSFSSGIEVVRLDVSVTRDGVPVKDLAASDFEVFDEGVQQKLELIGQEETAIHAVLALDTSQSVAGQELADLKAAAHLFVNALGPEDSLSLLTFSECTDLAIVSSKNREEAHAAIELATARRTTSLRDATLAALTLADPTLGRPLVLVFTDGQDVGSWIPAERVIDQAKESEVVVHAVAPTTEGSIGFIQQLTDTTGGRIWLTPEGDKLANVFLRALEEFRSRYRIQYEPDGVKPTGWHRVRVRLKQVDGKVRVRPGYQRRAN
jgi:VWFA-related protein